MDKRAQQKQLANPQVIETINNTEGISFIEFKDTEKLRSKLPPYIRLNISPWVEQSNTKEYNNDEVRKRLLNSLKSEAIHGKVIMMWGDYERPGVPEFAEVVLSEDYEWAIPLWQRGHGLSIYSFDRGYAWEATIFEDRYGFFRINLNEYKKTNKEET
ncbi:MAG: hypothetical protein ACFE0Q_16720 [Anaerolineae bacterium]